jgi:hypothetical protein
MAGWRHWPGDSGWICHLNAGQRAVAVAMIYPKTQQVKERASFETEKASATMLHKARLVLKHLPDKAKQVLCGSTSLESAYKEALDYY